MKTLSPFHLMYLAFLGLLTSTFYGFACVAMLRLAGQKTLAVDFLHLYTASFRTLFSLGLILGAFFIVLTTQQVIPQAIRKAFSVEQLKKTDYYLHEGRYFSLIRSLSLSALYAVISFAIFTECQFPLPRKAQLMMMAAVCAEYALGVYVGRKLFYAGMMVHALLEVSVTKNLFKNNDLDIINSYVNIVSTLTIVFVSLNVTNYLDGQYSPASLWSGAIQIFLIIPAVVATPVLLIFNFYPRIVLRRLYRNSVEVELRNLKARLGMEKFSAYERESFLMEFDRMSRDEIRYSLRLTLNDLPIGITILIMILGYLVRR